jgi:hypothetical protein
MRLLFLVVALSALLLPNVSMAQCVEEDWYGTFSVNPPGVGSIAPTSPLILFSEYDSSIYWVSGVQIANQEIINVTLNGASVQLPSCWPGKAYVIRKYSMSGELLWHRTGCYTSDGVVYGMAVDSIGNLYFGGFFKGTLRFEGTDLSQSFASQPSHFTMKIESNGELGWVRSGERSTALGHVWTDDGLLLFLSVTDSTTFNGQTYYRQSTVMPITSELVVLMVGIDGEVIWNQHIGGYGNKFVRHSAHNKSTCVIQGIYAQEITYDGHTLSHTGEVAKMYQLALRSNDGEWLWMKSQDNDGASILTNSACILDNGTLISAGHYIGSPSIFTFQDETISSSNGLTDGFIMGQDSETGNLLWLKTLGASGYSSVHGMAKTAAGVVVTGFFNSSELTFDGVQLYTQGDNDPFVILVDSVGKSSCYIQGLGTPTSESGNKVLTFQDDMYLLLGFSESTTFGEFSLQAQGNGDLALWKTCLPCDRVSSVSEASVPFDLILLQSDPNPFNDYTDIKYEHSGCGKCEIIISDVSGRIVKRIKTEGSSGTARMYSSEIGEGLYVYSLVVDGQVVRTERMVSSIR